MMVSSRRCERGCREVSGILADEPFGAASLCAREWMDVFTAKQDGWAAPKARSVRGN